MRRVLNLTAAFALAGTQALSADAADAGLEGGLTAVHLTQTESGRHDRSLSGDLIGTLQFDSGLLTIYVEGSTETSPDSIFNQYPEINGDAGSAQDARGNSRIQVSELHYRWTLANGHLLTLGQIDPSAHLDRGRLANDENTDFLGAPFVNNPAIEFPDYTVGLMYRVPRKDARPEFTMILSSSDGLADNPGRSYRELIDIAQDGKGAFVGLGTRWTLGPARVGVGAWFRSDDHPRLDDPDRLEQNYGAFAVYGWQSGAHGVNLRVGMARQSVSPAAAFAGAAYAADTRVGTFGIGAGRIFRSQDLDPSTTGHTTHLEAFFRVPIDAINSQLSFSLQHLKNAGFDSTGSIIDDDALFAGVRLHSWFGQ